MMVWKMSFLFQGCILRFHVNLPECSCSFLHQGTQLSGQFFLLFLRLRLDNGEAVAQLLMSRLQFQVFHTHLVELQLHGLFGANTEETWKDAMGHLGRSFRTNDHTGHGVKCRAGCMVIVEGSQDDTQRHIYINRNDLCHKL